MSRKISSYSFSSRALGLLLGCSAVLPSNKSFASEKRPNFIIILTDDQGYVGYVSLNSKTTIVNLL